MGNNIFQLLWTAIVQRFSRVVSSIRNLTNIARLRSIVIGKVIGFFSRLLDVKPKDKADYYTVFGYMISKRLAYLIVIILGAASAIIVVRSNATFFDGIFKTAEIRTYDYNSVMLRAAKGNVRIKAKSGYIAYEGEVKSGYVNGSGRLFDPDSRLVYEGEFVNSKYEGAGKRYYKNGNLMYVGDFANNMYNGDGTSYRSNGSVLYKGEFVNNLREGLGELYDNGGNAIYKGRFAKDEILYSELLGKAAAEVADAYQGHMMLYSDDNLFAVYMEDIGAIYTGIENEDALEDEVSVDKVYVLSPEFPVLDGTASVPSEVSAYLGEPIFEGSSYLTEEEAIALNLVREKTGERYYSDPSLELEYVYDDYYTVSNYDTDKMVYLYTYSKDGMEYTFVCSTEGASFGFYYISEGEDIEDNGESEAETE